MYQNNQEDGRERISKIFLFHMLLRNNVSVCMECIFWCVWEWLVHFMNDVQFSVYACLELMIYSRLLLYSSKYLFIFCIVDIKC